MVSKSRGFTFTINNYTENQADTLKQHLLDSFNIRYMIAGKEIAPTTGTKHIQGFLFTNNPVNQSAVIKKLKQFNSPHIEIAKGTPLQNKNYCSKENNLLFEYGEIPINGKRNDLNQVADKIKNGLSLLELYQQHPNHTKYVDKLYEYLQPKRNPNQPPIVIYIYGGSGCGKSRLAQQIAENQYSEDQIYYKSGNGKWFNGYDNQKCIIWNDYRDEDYTFNHFLQLLDRYPVQIENKGGIRQFNPETIIITSIKPIQQQYKNIEEDKAQLYRRITKYIKLNYESMEEKIYCLAIREFKVVASSENPFEDIASSFKSLDIQQLEKAEIKKDIQTAVKEFNKISKFKKNHKIELEV